MDELDIPVFHERESLKPKAKKHKYRELKYIYSMIRVTVFN